MLLIPLGLLLAISLVAIGCPSTPATTTPPVTTAPSTTTPPATTTPPSGPIHLNVANYFPAPALQSTILQDFCDNLTARTGGRVTADYYSAGSLLSSTAMFDGILDGVTDIGYSHVYYTPGRMPVTEGLGLPLGYPSAWVSGHVATDFEKQFMPQEFSDVVILWMNTSTPSGISTANKPIHTLEDLKGLTIRAPSVAGQVIAALGGTPAPTPMPEVYDAIAKGVLDGEASNFETLFSFKFADVVKYETSCWQITNPYPFYCAMNKDSYNKLPADIKPIFDELVGEYAERSQEMWNATDYLGKAAGDATGVQFIDLTPEEASRWQAAVQPVIDDWVNSMVAAGHSEAEVQGWLDYVQGRIDYWTQKQIEYRIPSIAGPPEVKPDALVQ
jgi:TRAP-type C4-dicarboxylate transport system substrate-binding protein